VKFEMEALFDADPGITLNEQSVKRMAVFWNVVPCSLIEVYGRIRGPCCLCHRLHGKSTHLCNVARRLSDYTAERHGRQLYSYSPP
jgi:hypothetical protein